MIIKVKRKVTHKQPFYPEDIEKGAIRTIGSVMTEGGGPLRGLSKEKERLILPEVINVSAEDKEFKTESKKFWEGMRIRIPHEGVTFDMRVDKDGYPLNVHEYVRGSIVLKHPWVSSSEEEMEKNPTKLFYYVDLDKEKKEKQNATQVRKDAFTMFNKVTADERTCSFVFSCLAPDSEFQKDITIGLSQEEKETVLEDVVLSKPQEFLKMASDKSLPQKAEISSLVKSGVITKSGNDYIYIDEVIGTTLNEVVAYFKNPRNSKKILNMRQTLKELSGGKYGSTTDEDIKEEEEENEVKQEDLNAVETTERGTPAPTPKNKGKTTKKSNKSK